MLPLLPGLPTLLLGSLVGCGGGPQVCPTPVSEPEPEWADANADGAVDLNDGVLIVRHALAGGDPPLCLGAGDLLETGDVATESAANIWGWLFPGTTKTFPTLDGCAERTERTEAPPCAELSLSLETESKVRAPAGTNASWSARVQLDSDGLDEGPDAWSFGVRAEGCQIVRTSYAGTASASTFADPPGIVDEGYSWAAVTQGGAVSAVIPSWRKPVQLVPERRSPRDVMVLSLEASAPASGCVDCTLSFDGSQRGPGEAVAVVVGHQGWSYVPTTTGATVQVCAE